MPPAPTRCDHCAGPLQPHDRYCPRCGGVAMWLTPTAEVPVAARVFLLVQVRKGAVTRIPIANPVVRLGRGPDCDVVIPHPRVSRLHAILELRDGAYHVSDARSTGGTFLGDHPVTGPVRLSSGDTLRLGRNPTDCATVVYHEER